MVFASIIVGLLIGSFLTVCVYRIPFGREKGPPRWDEVSPADSQSPESAASTKKLSIVYPCRSICPHCDKQLLWWHNIPLFSWIMLRGKCAFCKHCISFSYPLIELLTVLVSVFVYLGFGLNATSVLIFAFCCMLIVISFIDIDYYIIPDVISLPGTLLGVTVGILNHFTHFFHFPVVGGIWSSLIGLAFGAGILYFISEVYFRLRQREGLGMGDVKLLAMTGAFFGFDGAFYTIFFGSLAGSLLGLLMIMIGGRKMSQHLPFGPYLAIGTVIYLFVYGLSGASPFSEVFPVLR